MKAYGREGLFIFLYRRVRMKIKVSRHGRWSEERKIFGHRVKAASSPGMTAKDAADGQIESFQDAMTLNGFYCIL